MPVATTDALLSARRGANVLIRTAADHLQSFAADPDIYLGAFVAFLGMIRR